MFRLFFSLIKHHHIPREIFNFLFLLNIPFAKYNFSSKLPVFYCRYFIQSRMLLIIISWFYLKKVNLQSILYYKIQFSVLFRLKIIQWESTAFYWLGKYIFQYTSHIHIHMKKADFIQKSIDCSQRTHHFAEKPADTQTSHQCDHQDYHFHGK